MANSDYQTIDLPGFVLQGLAAKVVPGAGASQIIGDAWQAFTKGDYPNVIPEMTRGIILSMYTEYENKSNERYTVYVGCRVSADLALVPGLTRIEVPPSKYAMFLARGIMPQAAVDAWKQINAMPLKRAFAFDYDIYGPKSQNEEHSEVEIYVSIL